MVAWWEPVPGLNRPSECDGWILHAVLSSDLVEIWEGRHLAEGTAVDPGYCGLVFALADRVAGLDVGSCGGDLRMATRIEEVGGAGGVRDGNGDLRGARRATQPLAA